MLQLDEERKRRCSNKRGEFTGIGGTMGGRVGGDETGRGRLEEKQEEEENRAYILSTSVFLFS